MRIVVVMAALLVGFAAHAETCTMLSDCISTIAAKPNCANVVCTSNLCGYQRVDADHDGHAPPDSTCPLPNGATFVDSIPADDCDDNDPTSFRGSWDGPAGVVNGVDEPDRCDGSDHNCNGIASDDTVKTTSGTVSCTCAPRQLALCNSLPDGSAVPIPLGTQCRYGVRSCTQFGTWSIDCQDLVAPAAHDTCAKGDDSDCNSIPNEHVPCISGDKQPCPFPNDPKQNYCGGSYICKDDCSAPATIAECLDIQPTVCPFPGNTCQETETEPSIEFDLLAPDVVSSVKQYGLYIFPSLKFGQTYGASVYMKFTPRILDCAIPGNANIDLLTTGCDVRRDLTLNDFLTGAQPGVVTDPSDSSLVGWPADSCNFTVSKTTVEVLALIGLSTCRIQLSEISFRTSKVTPNCPAAFLPGPCSCDLSGHSEPIYGGLVMAMIAGLLLLRRRIPRNAR